jgi:DNA-binding IclR family transcriptional regulator
MLLAWLPESERDEIVKQQIAYLPKEVSIKKILAELNEFKQQIVLQNKSTFMEGITDISAPITLGSDKNKVIAVITIPYSSKVDAKLTLEETFSLLKEKAKYISSKSSIFGGL